MNASTYSQNLEANYEKRYNSLVDRHEEKKTINDELTAILSDKQAKSEIIRNFIKTVKRMEGMVETFNGGMEIKVLQFSLKATLQQIMHTKGKKGTLAHEVLGIYFRKTPRGTGG